MEDDRSVKRGMLLVHAVNSGDAEAAQFLLEKGACPNQKVELGGLTAMLGAVCCNSLELVDLLLAYGADINLIGYYTGYSPLYYAMQSLPMGMVQGLLERGADANKPDVHGNLPLHFACIVGNVEKVCLCLKYGADVNRVEMNKYRGPRTPLCLAVEYERIEVIRLLCEHGADILNDKKAFELAALTRNKTIPLVLTQERALRLRILLHTTPLGKLPVEVFMLLLGALY